MSKWKLQSMKGTESEGSSKNPSWGCLLNLRLAQFYDNKMWLCERLQAQRTFFCEPYLGSTPNYAIAWTAHLGTSGHDSCRSVGCIPYLYEHLVLVWLSGPSARNTEIVLVGWRWWEMLICSFQSEAVDSCWKLPAWFEAMLLHLLAALVGYKPFLALWWSYKSQI
jgi:hypothetical protein